jgi:hypothetical protein
LFLARGVEEMASRGRAAEEADIIEEADVKRKGGGDSFLPSSYSRRAG